jgi:hypothetical protein
MKPPLAGLWDLERVALSRAREQWLERVVRDVQGSPSWRQRVRVEVREVLALATIAPRLEVLALDARTALLLRLELRVPVPCRAAGAEELVLAPRARLVVRYPEAAMRLPQPGFAFVQIERPSGVFHPNVGGGDGLQLLCLGASIAAGTPVRELILASYQALSMAAYHLDPRAGAGVMSAEAAAWWSRNLDRLPLTREPFLGPATSAEEGARA